MKIVTVLGTRPEIVKLSSIIPLLDKEFEHILVHTGQHFDYNMDKIFFEELCLRNPDYHLDTKSSSLIKQISKMMIGIEKVIKKEKPNYVLVLADTNTPLAGTLVASKMNIPIIHLEAGCRSFNKRMPEEINRTIIDHCSSILLVPEEKAVKNLANEGITENVYNVGSTVFDACKRNVELAKNINIEEKIGVKNYIVVTIHRAENTNNIKTLKGLLEAINKISEKIEVVFPLHPRTKKIIAINKLKISESVKVIEPLGYLEFLKLMKGAKFILSDSGGIQEEAAMLNVPVVITRNETEWTYLVEIGKNVLAGSSPDRILDIVTDLLANPEKIERMKKIDLNIRQNISHKIVEVLKNELKE